MHQRAVRACLWLLPAAALLSVGLPAAGWFIAGALLSLAEGGEPGAATTQETARPKPPPLSLDGLLDEKLPEAKPTEKPQGKPKADNFACYVCHGNYEGEELVELHAKEGYGCVKCHGESLAHRDDEDHLTPPDVMFSAEKIDSGCGDCHDTHDAPAKKVIDRWQQRCPQKTKPEQLVCTDCHGKHRLEKRAIRWDKTTGKIIERAASPQSGTQPNTGSPDHSSLGAAASKFGDKSTDAIRTLK